MTEHKQRYISARSHVRARRRDARTTVNRILKIQLVATSLAVAASLFWGVEAAFSAAIGGGIGVVTTVSFAGLVLFTGQGLTAGAIARRFFLGEAAKIALTVVLFSLVFVWLDVLFLPLFLTYMATLLAYWLVLPYFL